MPSGTRMTWSSVGAIDISLLMRLACMVAAISCIIANDRRRVPARSICASTITAARVRRALSPRGEVPVRGYADTSWGQLHYESVGSGEQTIVLIHETGLSHSAFK